MTKDKKKHKDIKTYSEKTKDKSMMNLCCAYGPFMGQRNHSTAPGPRGDVDLDGAKTDHVWAGK